MKKPIYLLFALFMLSMVSCNYATNAKGNTMTEDPMAKENKSLVQKKEYKTQNGTVYLSGELQDTRTQEEILNDIPRKENIVNTLLYKGDKPKDVKIPFYPEFEIKKVIKYKTNDIRFTITAKIVTLKTITLPMQQKVQLQFAPDHSVAFNCNTTYKDISNEGLDFLHYILCSADITINKINELRRQQSDFSVTVQNAEHTFSFAVPQKFIECLNDI